MTKAKKSLLLSSLVWGSGQFFICKQRLKGVIFFAIQALMIGVELMTGYWLEWTMGLIPDFQMRLHSGYFTKGVWGLITLGDVPGAKVGDHSMMLMIDGIIIVILLAILGLIYTWNLVDAKASGKFIDTTNTYKTSKNYFIEFYNRRFVYILVTPVVLLVVFVTIMPILFSKGNLPPANLINWVGFENFTKLFTVPIWSSTFFSVLGWTVIWTVCATLSCYFLGMLQALILNNPQVKFKKLFRTIQILPWVMPSMICLLVFRNIFNGQFGPLNQFMLDSGLVSQRIPFLTDPLLAKVTVLGVNLWLGFGASMLMISGVLSNIDQSMYEAAKIDGAKDWQCFRFLTFPTLIRVTMPLLVMNFAGNFNNFGAIFFLTEGGPANPNYQFAGDTDILISWIYKLTLDNQMYSMASVMSILIFIFVGSVAFWNFRRTSAFKDA